MQRNYTGTCWPCRPLEQGASSRCTLLLILGAAQLGLPLYHPHCMHCCVEAPSLHIYRPARR
jgi:hypothetical protein